MKLVVSTGELELFDGAISGMVRSAHFDGEGDCYRYELGRVWDRTKPLLTVCMLNPSWASHLVDDPTILTLVHFGKLWGYGGLRIVNLYAWRSASPAEMKSRTGRMGPRNREILESTMKATKLEGGRLLAAWGNDGNFEGEAEWFVSRATGAHRLELTCLGTTLSGAPKHPMARGLHRIPRDQQPIAWRGPFETA